MFDTKNRGTFIMIRQTQEKHPKSTSVQKTDAHFEHFRYKKKRHISNIFDTKNRGTVIMIRVNQEKHPTSTSVLKKQRHISNIFEPIWNISPKWRHI